MDSNLFSLFLFVYFHSFIWHIIICIFHVFSSSRYALFYWVINVGAVNRFPVTGDFKIGIRFPNLITWENVKSGGYMIYGGYRRRSFWAPGNVQSESKLNIWILASSETLTDRICVRYSRPTAMAPMEISHSSTTTSTSLNGMRSGSLSNRRNLGLSMGLQVGRWNIYIYMCVWDGQMFFCQMFSRPKVLWIYTSLFILYSSHIRIEVGEGYKRMNLFVPVHLSIFC